MVAPSPPRLDRDILRQAIQEEYEVVATEPTRGFHFHTGRPLAARLGYDPAWLEGVPETSIQVLDLVVSYERGQWEQCATHCADLGVAEEIMAKLFAEAVRWVSDIFAH